VLTRTGGYALNAVLAIAQRQGAETPVRSAHIAEALGIPTNYLAKILHVLARAGLLESARGRTGGFRLARAPEAIKLLEVVAPFDDLGKERQCLLGKGTCSEESACPVHEEWRKASAPAFRFFEDRTVADLMNGGSRR
jgi:Rrf2 family protein